MIVWMSSKYHEHQDVIGCESPQKRGRSDDVAPSDVSAGRVARLSSQVLFGGASEVEIEHGGAIYRLRVTSLGKLLLTK